MHRALGTVAPGTVVLGAVGGVVAAGTALAAGHLVADLTGEPWPVDAVGVQVIDGSTTGMTAFGLTVEPDGRSRTPTRPAAAMIPLT